jgi:hypothetical protein
MRRLDRFILLGILLLAAVPRLLMSHDGLRATDELFSVLAGAGNRVGVDLSTGMQARTLFDGQVRSTLATTAEFDARNASLYHLALNMLFAAVGVSLVAARYVSVLAGLATVYVTCQLVRALGGTPREGLVAAAALAMHPLHVIMSAHARGYALATLLAALAALALLERTDSRPTPAIPSLILASTGASCSHLLASYLLALQSAIVAWFSRSQTARRGILFAWFIVLVGVAAALLMDARGGTLMAQRSADYASTEGVGGLAHFAKSAFLQSVELSGAHVYWSALGHLRARYSLLLPLATLAAILFGVGAALKKGQLNGSVLAGSVAAPLVFAVSASLLAGHRVPFWPQYATFATPWVAVAVGLATGHRRIGRGAAIMTLAILPLGLVSRAWPIPPDPFPAIRSLTNAHLGGGGTIVGPDDLLMRSIAVGILDLPAVRVQVATGSQYLEFRSPMGDLRGRVEISALGLCAFFEHLCRMPTDGGHGVSGTRGIAPRPRWTPENRPVVDASKPATSRSRSGRG